MDTNLYEKRERIQNQLVNTFLKGMNTDTSDMLLGSDQYRSAKNIRIVTNSNSDDGEVRIVEGNKLVEIVDTEGNQITGEIIAANTIRDIGIVIIKNANRWAIFKFRKNGDKFVAVRIFGWCSEDLQEELKSIDTVLRWESDNNIKLYICTGREKTPLWVLKFDSSFLNISTVPNTTSYFELSSIFIPSPIAVVSDVPGYIKGPVVQYSYRLYTENNISTNISSLTAPLSLYINNTKGAKLDKQSNKSVRVTIPDLQTSGLDKIQIFRVSYQQLGQEPVIDKILDTDYESGEYIFLDYGYSITSVSVSEYNAMSKTIVFPKSIESKGDYLFYGNVSYAEDSVNKDTKDIDVRCYSKGSYYQGTNGEVSVIDNGFNFPNIDVEVKNRAFNSSGIKNTNNEYWKLFDVDGQLYNGIGKYFAWKYVYNSVPLTAQNQTGTDKESYRTYRRGEVYRFGVRLFNKKGYGTSVKWMCDIQIPTDVDPISIDNDGNITANVVSIEFTPLNTFVGTDIVGYEIVQCIRSIKDKYTISQGLVGALTTTGTMNIDNRYNAAEDTYDDTVEESGYVTFNGFVTLDDIYARPYYISSEPNSGTDYKYFTHQPKIALPYNKAVMFASPEYCYQPDDVKDIIEQYDINHIKLKFNRAYIPKNEDVQPEYDLLIETYDNVGLYDPDRYSTKFATTVGAGNIPAYSLGYKNLSSSDKFTRELFGYFYDITVGIFNNGIRYHEDSVKTGYMRDTENNGVNVYSWNNNQDMLVPYGIKNPFVSYVLDETNSNTLTWYTKGYLNTDAEKQQYNLPQGNILATYENNTSGKHFLNLFTPLRKINDPFKRRPVQYQISNPDITNISDVDYIKSADPTKYQENDVTIITANSNSVGKKQFINWSAIFFPLFSAENKSDYAVFRDYDRPYLSVNNNTDGAEDNKINPENALFYPISAGGKYIIFSTPDNVPNESASPSLPPAIYIYDLEKNAVPYDGYNKTAIKNSRYVSMGGGCPITSNVKLKGGDSFIKMFVYNAGHDWYSPGIVNAVRMSSIYIVPIETDIDLQGQYSDSLFIGKDLSKQSDEINRTNKSYYIQDEPFVAAGYMLEDAAYMYNTAYNVSPDVFSYFSDMTTKGDNNNYDTRVHYSNRKINNESIDNWSSTMPLNFIDVDSRYGEITDLKLFKDKLIYWQKYATGVLSVNERMLITTEDDNKLALGYGGILDRYDYISTIYGMNNNERCCVDSDSTLYWWDSLLKTLLAYREQLIPLSDVKNIKNYTNKESDTNNIPTLLYDNKYKEVTAHVLGNESIVYNEKIQLFTSLYTYCPQYYFDLDGKLYTADKNIENISETNAVDNNGATWYGQLAKPCVEYVVNHIPTYNKTFDILTFGGRFYGGGYSEDKSTPYGDKYARNNDALKHLTFTYKTPLKQNGSVTGEKVTNVEYDYKLVIPRDGDNPDWGNRLRGKTMQCKIESDTNNLDFALQYVTTKFRMSWT